MAADHTGFLWLGVEAAGLLVYAAFAVLGFKRSPWFLVAGIMAHGLAWDIWHIGNSRYIPNWYSVGCLVVDVSLGVYVAIRIAMWETQKVELEYGGS